VTVVLFEVVPVITNLAPTVTFSKGAVNAVQRIVFVEATKVAAVLSIPFPHTYLDIEVSYKTPSNAPT